MLKVKQDFISYIKTLRAEDWRKQVTEKWDVKDVVAHMVGWEKYDPQIIRKAWETKESPWWHGEEDYDEYNRKEIEYYKNYTTEELIEEWQVWLEKVEEEIESVGEQNLRSRPDLFEWLFDNSENSHYHHHLRQIKEVLYK